MALKWKQAAFRWLSIATLALSGCGDAAAPSRPPESSSAPSVSAPKDGKYHVLALGDSYTSGESVDADDRWPVQLVKLLRAKGVDAADPQLIAVTGWTTQELSAAIDAAKPTGTFDLVTLLIGVNNQFRHYDIKAYPAEFDKLLDRAIGFAGGDASHVVVLSIPDWGITPFAQQFDRAQIGKDIDAYNTINRAETQSRHAIYVDITGISRQCTTQPSLQAQDGLHPSGEQYAQWAKAAFESLPVTKK